jgi:hypothetical protein
MAPKESETSKNVDCVAHRTSSTCREYMAVVMFVATLLPAAAAVLAAAGLQPGTQGKPGRRINNLRFRK